jgi:hypothetical protein
MLRLDCTAPRCVVKHYLERGLRGVDSEFWLEDCRMISCRNLLLWRRKPMVSAAALRAHNSAVECHLHTVEVVGSNPAVPTIPFNNLGGVTVEAFAAFCGKSSDD